MQEKSYKGLVWFVIILIILVVALMGFIIYREFYSENKTDNINITEEKPIKKKLYNLQSI